MNHARTQHANARLTPRHRRNMVDCVIKKRWTVEATADRFQVDAKTVRKGGIGSWPRANRVCWIVHHGQPRHPTQQPGRSVTV